MRAQVSTRVFGLPDQPSAIAHDPVQDLLAIGSKWGALMLYGGSTPCSPWPQLLRSFGPAPSRRRVGKPGVCVRWAHPQPETVKRLLFVPGRGRLLSVCGANALFSWDLTGAAPGLEFSLTIAHERITHCHLPPGSDYLLVGTEKGNVYFLRVSDFAMSSLTIFWNYTAPPGFKEHPGPVVLLEPNPLEPAKLLIGYGQGRVVLYDTKEKTPEKHYATKMMPVRPLAD